MKQNKEYICALYSNISFEIMSCFRGRKLSELVMMKYTELS